MPKFSMQCTLLSLAFLLLLACSSGSQKLAVRTKVTYLFAGSYTDGKPGDGIKVYRIDTGSGALTLVSTVENITNPSYITLSPDGKYLYACTETRMHGRGSVTAFAFDSISGRLSFINNHPSGGENPVYLTVDAGSKWLVNANYTGGSVSVFPLLPDGSIGPIAQLFPFKDSSVNEERQDSAHIHAVVFTPSHDYLLAPDLGADKIRLFDFNPLRSKPLMTDTSSFIRTSEGSGQSHLVFHPRLPYAYCVEELSGTVSTWYYSQLHNTLSFRQRLSSYAHEQDDYASADIHISPDGNFLYASNREDENSLAIFAIDTASGLLRLLGHQTTMGQHPRNFVIDPTGKWLMVANMLSDNIVVFERRSNGQLQYTGHQITMHHPSCLQIRTYSQ